MMNESLMLMIIGMSTVFIFLTILVFVMYLSSRFIRMINKIFPEVEEIQKTKLPVNGNNEDIAIVIAAVKNKQN